MSILRRYCT